MKWLSIRKSRNSSGTILGTVDHCTIQLKSSMIMEMSQGKSQTTSKLNWMKLTLEEKAITGYSFWNRSQLPLMIKLNNLIRSTFTMSPFGWMTFHLKTGRDLLQLIILQWMAKHMRPDTLMIISISSTGGPKLFTTKWETLTTLMELPSSILEIPRTTSLRGFSRGSWTKVTSKIWTHSVGHSRSITGAK